MTNKHPYLLRSSSLRMSKDGGNSGHFRSPTSAGHCLRTYFVSTFRCRCCFKYQSNLLFLGRKSDTARESSCHPWMNTKLRTLDLASAVRACWCILWFWDNCGEDGTEEDPFVALLDLAGEVRLEPPGRGERLGDVDELIIWLLERLPPAAPFPVPELPAVGGWWEKPCPLDCWFSFECPLLEESHRKRDCVALSRKCCEPIQISYYAQVPCITMGTSCLSSA